VKTEIEYDFSRLIAAIYSGAIDEWNLPRGLYQKTAEKFIEAVNKGMEAPPPTEIGGGTGFAMPKPQIPASEVGISYMTPDEILRSELIENVYVFSGAKIFQEVKELVDNIAPDGIVRPFNQFKKQAEKIIGKYNQQWLQAEYNTALGSAQSARDWQEFEEDIELFPYLRYDAIIDPNTSDICRPLEGITLPVNHPFWNKFSPLNHFNCRCRLIKISQYEPVKKTGKKKLERVAGKIEPNMQELFMMNPGKEKLIFKETGKGKHPYFNISPKYKSYAQNNFNLPIPERFAFQRKSA
jgi:SPP1 gp7 family putative phage head morphogenesis protein